MYAKLFFICLASAVLAESSYTPLPYPSEDNALQSLDKIESAPYAPYPGLADNTNDGYTIQSGYEGYLIPYEDIEPALSLLETKGFIAAGLKIIQSFPKLALKLVLKAIPHVLFIGAIVIIGGAITTAVCSFTSICSAVHLGAFSHLPFKFDKEQVRSLVTEDKINAASSFVKTAIENFYKTHGLKKTSKSKLQ